MIRATVSKLERHLAPDDGIARALVGLQAVPGGFICDACGATHASLADAERAHPGATLILEEETSPQPPTESRT